MTLSEAIRLGSMLHPQAFGRLVTYRDAKGRYCKESTEGAVVAASCALGAAGMAGYADPNGPIRLMTSQCLSQPCPVCAMELYFIHEGVIHLNDVHHWPRPQIADWVEAHEPVPEAVMV